ncbi:MAG: DEAD/DEAH box helicase family protein [Myxococcota bacterium]|nr:DEAD/DEAH box helicase family protein [Myxococcota bacterium]
MSLDFDRGTITLSGCSESAAANLPGVLWDPRTQSFRAPAHRFAELREAMARAGHLVVDRVITAQQEAGAHLAREWKPVELRSYQAAALSAWSAANARGLVSLPTGSGKTRLAIAAMARRRCRALCLVPTRVLLEQWRLSLGEFYSGPIGQYGDGKREALAVTVATFASAFHHMEVLGNRFDLVVVDEAHHFGAGPGDEALELCAAPARLGLTGTPPTEPARHRRLAELIGREVYRQRVADLAGEFLAPLRVVTLSLDLNPEERRAYSQEVSVYLPVVRHFFRYSPRSSWRDFQRAAVRSDEGRRALGAWRRSRQLVAFTEEKRATLARLLGEHRGDRLLIFTGDNDASYAIAREHCVMPVTSDIRGTERAEALERFSKGELRALVSSQVLNEGIDVPAADTAILIGGRLGTREYLQRVGRLLRPAPEKEAVAYELVTRNTHEVGDARRRRRELGP